MSSNFRLFTLLLRCRRNEKASIYGSFEKLDVNISSGAIYVGDVTEHAHAELGTQTALFMNARHRDVLMTGKAKKGAKLFYSLGSCKVLGLEGPACEHIQDMPVELPGFSWIKPAQGPQCCPNPLTFWQNSNMTCS